MLLKFVRLYLDLMLYLQCAVLKCLNEAWIFFWFISKLWQFLKGQVLNSVLNSAFLQDLRRQKSPSAKFFCAHIKMLTKFRFLYSYPVCSVGLLDFRNDCKPHSLGQLEMFLKCEKSILPVVVWVPFGVGLKALKHRISKQSETTNVHKWIHSCLHRWSLKNAGTEILSQHLNQQMGLVFKPSHIE